MSESRSSGSAAKRPPSVLIVGAGPAGMVLAYQLVSHGVPVRVLERHADFRREFRGELIHASVLAPLTRIGVLPILRQRGLASDDVERRMFVGETRQVQVPGGNVRGSVISQEGLLELLHELCSAYPHYRLDFGTTALEVIKDGDKVTGVTVRGTGTESRIHADLVVSCSGRHTALRKSAGLSAEPFHVPADTLWLRFDFSDAPQALPSTVDVHMWGDGIVMVLFATRGARLQLAFSAPGDLGALRKDLPALRAQLLPLVPEALRPHIAAKLDERVESQMFKVAVDRLPTWYAPGILFLGDAAHTMSPAGGIGLNVAMIDAFVAADAMLAALDAGQPLDEQVFAAIQKQREPDIIAAQSGQLRAHAMCGKRRLGLHLMFSILPVFLPLINKKVAAAARRQAPVEIRYASPASCAPPPRQEAC